MVGMLATSKAGHDKTEVYVIVAEDEKYIYLCDGRLKPLEKPKKKSRIKLMLISLRFRKQLILLTASAASTFSMASIMTSLSGPVNPTKTSLPRLRFTM